MNRSPAQVVVDAPVGCVHHWMIETPNGALSTGVCKRCGQVKSNFYNWERDMDAAAMKNFSFVRGKRRAKTG